MTDKLPTKAVFAKSIHDPATTKVLLLQCFHHGVNCLGGSETVSDKCAKDATAVLVQVWDAYPVELEGLLVDVVWFASSATRGDEPKTKALAEMLSCLVAIPDRESFWKQLQETLDPSLLQACGLLTTNDANTLTKKISKLNTELYYKQQKYNLLQEQSEGYAKLLTVLFGDLNNTTPQVLREYMGAFDLDPNRVLDILLDLVDNHDRKDKILELMREFSLPKLPNLLAFKLTHYRTTATPIPPPLLRTIILLADEGLLELKSLVPAAVEDLHACFALHKTLLQSQISRLARISLTSDNGNRPDTKLQECQRLLQEGTTKLETQNVLVGLAHLLMLDQNWELAWTMLPNTEDWVQLCTLQPLKVGKELCQWVSTQILKVQEGSARNLVSKSSETMCDEDNLVQGKGKVGLETAEEGFESCYAALVALGQSGCLSNKPTLYSDLCHLMRAMLQAKGFDKLSPTIYNLLRLVLVPTLSLLPPDPGIAADLWSVLSILPYSTRYQLYRDWRGGGLERAGMGSKPLLQVLCEMEAGKAARYTLKRLSKDNIRDMGRQVSKVTHSNPLVVFSTILGQIESYDNLIQMMVETIRLVTPLSLDVLGYCVLTRLSGVGGVNRSRLKGTNNSNSRSKVQGPSSTPLQLQMMS
jgi:THO complex subunit 2